MSDPTLAVRPVIPFIQSWLSNNAANIQSYASAVGLKATSIVGGVVQEASTILTQKPATQYFASNENPYGVQLTGNITVERTADALIDNVLIPTFSSTYIAQDYAARQSDIANGIAATWYQKLTSPTGNDIGYGNINLGTAIMYLQRYYANPGYFISEPTSIASDPLNLDQYQNNYAKLASDLTSPNSGATFAIAALVAKQGYNDFRNAYGPAFDNLTPNQQAALLTTFYKQGEAQIISKVPPEPDGIYPPLPDPSAGSGAPFVLENYLTIESAISGNGSPSSSGQPFVISPPGTDVAPLEANPVVPVTVSELSSATPVLPGPPASGTDQTPLNGDGEDSPVSFLNVETSTASGKTLTDPTTGNQYWLNASGGSVASKNADDSWTLEGLAAGSPSFKITDVQGSPSFDNSTGNLNVTTAVGTFALTQAGAIASSGAVFATIGTQSVTLLGGGGSSPFAVVSSPGTTPAGSSSSNISITTTPVISGPLGSNVLQVNLNGDTGTAVLFSNGTTPAQVGTAQLGPGYAIYNYGTSGTPTSSQYVPQTTNSLDQITSGAPQTIIGTLTDSPNGTSVSGTTLLFSGGGGLQLDANGNQIGTISTFTVPNSAGSTNSYYLVTPTDGVSSSFIVAPQSAAGTSGGTTGTALTIALTPTNTLPDGSSVVALGTGSNAPGVAFLPASGSITGSVQFLNSSHTVLAETTSSGINLIAPDANGNYSVVAAFSGNTLPTPVVQPGGATSYSQTTDSGTTSVTIFPPSTAGGPSAVSVVSSYSLPVDANNAALGNIDFN